MALSIYYQAYIPREKTLYLAALLKSCEHVCIDRTLDAETGLLEFFVSPNMHEEFKELVAWFVQHGMMHSPQQLPNRFMPEVSAAQSHEQSA